MNINFNAASAVAGTSRAAARGGEADNQASESVRQQVKGDAPAGKAAEATVDAGEQTDDRGGNGQQVLDTFERSEEEAAAEEQSSRQSPPPSDDEHQLDFEA